MNQQQQLLPPLLLREGNEALEELNKWITKNAGIAITIINVLSILLIND
jgi:hypothetical protein